MKDHKSTDVDLFLVYHEWAAHRVVKCKNEWVKEHQDRVKKPLI
jgi:hypothetical protein